MGEMGEIRISDREREATIAVLRSAVGEGRITLDEFADRAAEAYGARTQSDLDTVIADLPAALAAPFGGTSATSVQTTRSRRVQRWIIAIMSGQTRRGRWRLGERTTAFAWWGAVDLDLRGAEIEAPEVELTAWAIMGGVDVIVPDGIPVEMTGFVLMGASDNKVADVPVLPGAPRIRVRARGMWGGVTVRSKPLEGDAREQRRADKQARRDERRQQSRPARRSTAESKPSSSQPPEPMQLPTPSIGDMIPPMPAAREPVAAARPDHDLTELADAVRASPPDLRAQAAADGTVTILFTDIEGSAAIADRLGDRRWLEVLHHHDQIVRHQVIAAGGTVVKSQGDGFMVTFTSARRAVRCAIDIQRALIAGLDPSVRVRIGVHTGEVLSDAGDFFGKNVILAARIAEHARGGEILVSGLVRELVDGSDDLPFGEPDEVELKGLARAYRLHTVDWHAGR